MSVPDEVWAPVARSTRDALALLGRPIEPTCLPDEAEPCGASFALHAVAHFATIKAICDHQLEHLGTQFLGPQWEIYWGVIAELEQCGQAAGQL